MDTPVTTPPASFSDWKPYVTTEPFVSLGRRRQRLSMAVGYRCCPHGIRHFDATISDRIVAERAWMTVPAPCPDEQCRAVVAEARKAGKT